MKLMSVKLDKKQLKGRKENIYKNLSWLAPQENKSEDDRVLYNFN
jgi:hypothetical protein